MGTAVVERGGMGLLMKHTPGARRIATLAAVALTAAVGGGCGESPATAPATALATATATVPPAAAASMPDDLVVALVSASSPGGAASAVLERCGVTADAPGRVAGMAELATAQDLSHYVPMTGREPVLRWDGPAWVVRLRGEVPMPKIGETWVDPACIVVESDDGGLSGFYAVGGWIDADGTMHPPIPPATETDRSLPTLAP